MGFDGSYPVWPGSADVLVGTPPGSADVLVGTPPGNADVLVGTHVSR